MQLRELLPELNKIAEEVRDLIYSKFEGNHFSCFRDTNAQSFI